MDGDVPSTPRQLLENLLGQGMVMVTIDARADGAIVPRHFDRDPQLRLNLSYRFGLPIHIDEWGVKARLTFSGVPFDCEMPWSAIYMIVSHVTGQPFLFPEQVPQELMQLATQMRTETAGPEPKKPKLTVISSSDSATENEDESEAEGATIVPPSPLVAHSIATDGLLPANGSTGSPHETTSPADNASEPQPPRTPPRRGHLRVVK